MPNLSLLTVTVLSPLSVAVSGALQLLWERLSHSKAWACACVSHFSTSNRTLSLYVRNSHSAYLLPASL